MLKNDTILLQLKSITEIASAGFAMAFHFERMRPSFMLQSYPENWTSCYTKNGYGLVDPVIAWGLAHEGCRRWTNYTASEDPSGVIAMAHKHGLHFGIGAAVALNGTRSISTFARSDRDFDDDEISELYKALASMHSQTSKIMNLDADDIKLLPNMDIIFSKI